MKMRARLLAVGSLARSAFSAPSVAFRGDARPPFLVGRAAVARCCALPQFGEQRLEGRRLSSRDQAVHTCSRDARPREGEKGIGHAPAHSQRARRTRSSAHATAVRDPRARKATFDSGVNAGCTASSQSRCRVHLVLHLPRVVSNVHRAQRLGRLHDIAHVMCTTLHRESGTRKRRGGNSGVNVATLAGANRSFPKRC